MSTAPHHHHRHGDEPDEPDDVPRFAGLRHGWAAADSRTRRLVALGVVLTLVGTVVAVWWGLSSTVGKPSWSDRSYDVRGPEEVVVRFELSRPEDMTVTCTIEAKETSHGTVGRTVVTIPPGAPASAVHQVTVRTTSLAVIGQVRTCAQA